MKYVFLTLPKNAQLTTASFLIRFSFSFLKNRLFIFIKQNGTTYCWFTNLKLTLTHYRQKIVKTEKHNVKFYQNCFCTCLSENGSLSSQKHRSWSWCNSRTPGTLIQTISCSHWTRNNSSLDLKWIRHILIIDKFDHNTFCWLVLSQIQTSIDLISVGLGMELFSRIWWPKW